MEILSKIDWWVSGYLYSLGYNTRSSHVMIKLYKEYNKNV
jgi:hypothetical protein